MAKLVIGKNKIKAAPAILKDSSPDHYIEKTVDANGKLQNSTNIINLNDVTDVGDGALAYAYYDVYFPNNTSADLSSLTTISGKNACQSMFKNSPGITSVDLSSLTTISGESSCQYMFSDSTSLTSVDLSSLTTISGKNACQSMFITCNGLTSINLSSLTTVNGDYSCQSMFSYCDKLTSIDLSSLTIISEGYGGCSSMFSNCSKLTSIDLSSLTTISGTYSCNTMFQNCTNLTTFKANKLNVMSSQIASNYSQMFYGCSKLESVEFGGLTASTFSSVLNQFQYLFNNYTGSTATNGCTLHFPSNFDPSDPNHTFDITTLSGYPTFGGSASYIHLAYDLPATE